MSQCCRYPVTTKVEFVKKEAFGAGMLIVADGNIRSNDSLFFLGEQRVAVAAIRGRALSELVEVEAK